MPPSVATAIQILQALLTPFIAIVATYVAWQQWKGNQLKLRLERYERRLRIYREVVKILILVLRDADVKTDDLLRFRAATAEADFLFGAEIPEYIEEVFRRGLRLSTVNKQYRDARQETAPGYDHQQIVEESHAQLTWLSDQFPVAKAKFAKYLNVSE